MVVVTGEELICRTNSCIERDMEFIMVTFCLLMGFVPQLIGLIERYNTSCQYDNLLISMC